MVIRCDHLLQPRTSMLQPISFGVNHFEQHLRWRWWKPYCLTKKKINSLTLLPSTKGCIQINQPPKKEGIIFKIYYYSIHWEKSWRCDLSRALFFHFRAVEELQNPNKVGPKTTYNWLVDVNPFEHICSSNWIMSPILGLTIKIYLKPPAR